MCLLLVIDLENLGCSRLNCSLLPLCFPVIPVHLEKFDLGSCGRPLKSFWLYTSSANAIFPLDSSSRPSPYPQKSSQIKEHLSDCLQRESELQVSRSEWLLMLACLAAYNLESFVRQRAKKCCELQQQCQVLLCKKL